MGREQEEENIGIKGVNPEPGTGVNTWNPSNWKVMGGHRQTHRELKARLDYMKTCLQSRRQGASNLEALQRVESERPLWALALHR